MSKRKFLKNILNSLKKDARKKHEISKETLREVKDAYNICVEEEKVTNADFKEEDFEHYDEVKIAQIEGPALTKKL